MIDPAQLVAPAHPPEHCAICWFQEAIAKLRQDGALRTIFEDRWEDGAHPFYEPDVDGRRLGLCYPGVGGPVAAGMVEGAIARRCGGRFTVLRQQKP